jgi:hypothetical protein
MTSPAYQEAQEINRLMPATYFHGVFYPVTYNGNEIKIARTTGKGRNAGKYYLHVIRPCKINTKLPDGTIVDTRQGTAHYSIELSDNSAWKEVTFG